MSQMVEVSDDDLGQVIAGMVRLKQAKPAFPEEVQKEIDHYLEAAKRICESVPNETVTWWGGALL